MEFFQGERKVFLALPWGDGYLRKNEGALLRSNVIALKGDWPIHILTKDSVPWYTVSSGIDEYGSISRTIARIFLWMSDGVKSTQSIFTEMQKLCCTTLELCEWFAWWFPLFAKSYNLWTLFTVLELLTAAKLRKTQYWSPVYYFDGSIFAACVNYFERCVYLRRKTECNDFSYKEAITFSDW